MFQIKSLSEVAFDDIYKTYREAFKDYPVLWDKELLYKTITRRGYVAALSFGAFYKDELVSFTLNGVGSFNGRKSAYDTGTGTVEQHRAKGLASRIFEYAVPFLQSAGIEQYVLEVLSDNERAFSVYKKQGFEVRRMFDCFKTNNDECCFGAGSLAGCGLREIDLSYTTEMEAMHDCTPSWQNSFNALQKHLSDFIIIGAFQKDKLVGYGIIEPQTGDVPQLAVSPDSRRKGLGLAILSALQQKNEANILKVLNIEANQSGIIQFIHKAGFPKIVGQYEMIKSITT